MVNKIYRNHCFGQVVEFAALPGSVFRHTQSCSCVTFSNEHEADTAPSHDKEAVCRKVKLKVKQIKMPTVQPTLSYDLRPIDG